MRQARLLASNMRVAGRSTSAQPDRQNISGPPRGRGVRSAPNPPSQDGRGPDAGSGQVVSPGRTTTGSSQRTRISLRAAALALSSLPTSASRTAAARAPDETTDDLELPICLESFPAFLVLSSQSPSGPAGAPDGRSYISRAELHIRTGPGGAGSTDRDYSKSLIRT